MSLSKWKRQFLDNGAEIFSGHETVKRNLLLEHILQERRSSKDMDAVIEKLQGGAQRGGDHE